MSDLQLTAGSLATTNGDLVVCDGLTAIAQDVETRLRMFLGEWFLDTSKGTPWLQRILVKNPSVPSVLAALSQIVTTTPGVLSITQRLTWSYNGVDRSATVTFKANTTSGPIEYTGNFGL